MPTNCRNGSVCARPWMAVEHYKASNPQGRALGEITILMRRELQTEATFSLSTNTQAAIYSQPKHRTK